MVVTIATDALQARDRRLAERQARFCAVFSSPVRLQIMLLLGNRELTVGEIAEALEYPLPLISQHLRLMRDKGCLGSRKEGKNVFYSVASHKFQQALQLVRQGLLEGEY